MPDAAEKIARTKTSYWEPRHVGTGTFKATERMHELVTQVLASGRISYGPMSQRLEKEVAHLHNCDYGVLSNSGTSSLHVALQALKEVHGWADGDEVIVPALTFVATINVVLHNRLTPVFVDVEPDTFGMDPTLLMAAVTDRTRAVIPVHLFGQACRMTSIMKVVEVYGLKVIEDSCETMFVSHFGSPVGSMGDIGCFSFYNAHLLTAGVGGMAVTNRPEYASKMRSLVNHGLDIGELNVDENFSPRPMTGRAFRFTHPGHSFRITELEAALALAQLEDKDHILGGRRRNARHLTASLGYLNDHWEAKLIPPAVGEGNEHAWMMYPIMIGNDNVAKTGLTRWLNENGIETRDMMPITNQPIFSSMLEPNDFTVADWINHKGFYIGCHQELEPDDMEYVKAVMGKYFERNQH